MSIVVLLSGSFLFSLSSACSLFFLFSFPLLLGRPSFLLNCDVAHFEFFTEILSCQRRTLQWELVFATVRASVHTPDMPDIYETFRQMFSAWDVSAYFFCRNVRRHVFAETSFAETSGIQRKWGHIRGTFYTLYHFLVLDPLWLIFFLKLDQIKRDF